MPRKRPQSDRDNVIKLYTSGLSYALIAEKIGADVGWIGNIVTAAGVGRSRSDARKLFYRRGGQSANFREDLPVPEICMKYLTGTPSCKIAEAFKVSDHAITRCLRDGQIAKRTVAQARLLIDREQSSALVAKSRSRKVGWGEDVIYQWLKKRGEFPNLQLPIGNRNIDIALPPIAVEIVVGTTTPFKDPYYFNRVKYLANHGWVTLYIFIARRTKALVPSVADQ